MDFRRQVDIYFERFLDYLPTIIFTIILFVIGLIAIKLIMRYLRGMMNRRKVDEALRGFLLNLISFTLKILLVLMVISNLGIKTTSLLALIGSAGLAIGLALQGSLSNFAGGVIIILLQPIRIGDWIESNGVSGTVKEISLFYTRLINTNNLLVSIPNGALSNQTIVNYTILGKRIDYIKVRVAKNTDLDLARKVLIGIMTQQEGVIENTPHVNVLETAPEYIELSANFTAKVKNFWTAHFKTIEAIEGAFKEAGIQFPAAKFQVDLLKGKEG